jgi:hypothetical protein
LRHSSGCALEPRHGRHRLTAQHARDVIKLGPGWIHAPFRLKATRRSAAHRLLGEKMRSRMPLLTAVGRSRAAARHYALRHRGRRENMNHHRCCSMKVRAGRALPRRCSTVARPPRAHTPARGPMAVPSLGELQCSTKGVSALGFSGEKRAPVLFELKIDATVGSR